MLNVLIKEQINCCMNPEETEHSFILGESGKFLEQASSEMGLKTWVWPRHAEI